MFLPRRSAYRRQAKPGGSILIISLWSLCLLSTFAVILSYGVRQKATLVKRLDERAKLSLCAEAAVRQAVAYLQNSEKNYDALNDPWTQGAVYKDMAIGDGRCSIAYEYTDAHTGERLLHYGLMGEEGKININKAPAGVLEGLFVLAGGCDEASAKDLAVCVVDWRDNDAELSTPASAEDAYYKRLSFPYAAANSDFQVLEELLLVKGVDEALFSRIKDYLTVYGSGLVNANTAQKEVLMSLGLDDYTAGNIILFRNGDDETPGTADDGIFESSLDITSKMSAFCHMSTTQIERLNTISQQNLTTKSDNFMIKCMVNVAGIKRQMRASCVVSRTGKILYWHQA